jgi:hypothetical protein
MLIRHADAAALAIAMRRFLDHPSLLPDMARESRQMAVERFDVHEVNRVILEALDLG